MPNKHDKRCRFHDDERICDCGAFAWDKVDKLESERDEALAESRKRGEENLMLREALGYAHRIFIVRGVPEEDIAYGKVYEALSNTSATAQRVKDEIERDTRKAIWDAVKDMWGASPMQFRAAILNPEGPDANTENPNDR